MIVLDVVGGFLGAGKTTWLRRLLAREPDRYGAVIVNEAAQAGVDHRSVGGLDPQAVHLVAGGCVCCDGRAELRDVLHDLVADRHRGRHLTDLAVVLETSGVTDPWAVAGMIGEDPVLAENVRVGQVIALVDGVDGTAQLRHRRLAQRQVLLATTVLVSRSDLVGPEVLAGVVSHVRSLNPHATVCDARTAHPLEPGAPVEVPELGPSGDATDGEPLLGWSTPVSAGTSWPEYAVWLELMTRRHPTALLRTKAVLPGPDGVMLVQSVGRMVLPVERAWPGHDLSVASVSQGIRPECIEKSLRAFVPSAFESRVPRT